MAQSLCRILIHLVFSTKNSGRMITPANQPELSAYLTGILKGIGCPPLQSGGVDDHVHILFGLSRTRTVAGVVETVKTVTSKWLKTKGSEFRDFHWQAGYGAFSVSQSEAEAAGEYIRQQPVHHRRISFQDEFRRLLERHQVAYDERYIWD